MSPAVAQRQVTKGIHLPAPMGGVNALMGASAMAANDCIFLFNLIPGAYGLRVRDGYKEWAIGIGEEVRALPSFGGETLTDDRLFAVTASGIWDVTTRAAAPVKVATFADPTHEDSGWGTWTNFVTLDEKNILLYADDANGLWVYSGSTGLWTEAAADANFFSTPTSPAGSPTPPSPSEIAAVMGWKNRIWYVQKNTGVAWYTDVGTYRGDAWHFTFGNKFRRGGWLVNLFNWTVDGGFGIDDYLVGVGSKGDVVIYQGSDPTTDPSLFGTGFNMRGVWTIGTPPRGRRCGTVYGGDLLLLSTLGVIPVSRLLQAQAAVQDQYSSKKISPYIMGDMKNTYQDHGWEMYVYPARNCLIVNSPSEYGNIPGQYSMFIPTESWGFYRDLPARCWATWNDKSFFGTSDGRVCIHDGPLDNVSLDLTRYVQIDWSALTSFTDWGVPVQLKRGQYGRAMFIANSLTPAYLLEFRYNFNLAPITNEPVAMFQKSGLWEKSMWDSADWGGSLVFNQYFFGGVGMGPHCAVAVRGASTADTVLVGFDVLFDMGGYL